MAAAQVQQQRLVHAAVDDVVEDGAALRFRDQVDAAGVVHDAVVADRVADAPVVGVQ
jgi:hypothetical protein